MEMRIWKQAAGHSLSAGMEKGIITDFAKEARNRLTRAKNVMAVRALDFLVCWAIGEPHLPADGSIPHLFFCVRCDQRTLATRKHELWECLGNNLINHTHMQKSGHLVKLAHEFRDTDRVLFARCAATRWVTFARSRRLAEVRMWESHGFSECANSNVLVASDGTGCSRDTPNKDFKSGAWIWQVPYSTNIFVLEDIVQDGGVFLFTFSYEGYVMEQRSGGGCFRRSIHGVPPFPEFESLDARIASSLNKIIQNSYFKKKVSLEEQAQKADSFLRGRQNAYLIYDYYRATGVNDSVLDDYDLFSVVHRKIARNFGIFGALPSWWHSGKSVQIQNTRVWEIEDRIRSVQHGDSSEKSETWLPQIGGNG